MSAEPHYLLTNDDGIDSPFLQALVNALTPFAKVTLVAPAHEQSWISKAITRFRELEGRPLPDPSWHQGPRENLRAFTVSGTPADCVNLGLFHFCETRPEAVLSGINIGFNAGLPFILSSGTVAGALEGSLQRLTAIALSLALPPEAFVALQENPPRLPAEVKENLHRVTARIPELVQSVVQEKNSALTVHNFNFPTPTHANTPVRTTRPARLHLGGLFEEHRPGFFHFAFPGIDRSQLAPNSDAAALQEGAISHSRLSFQLG
ncbi:MAG: 5'/3'-nucleotidase SurE [Opitutales bacterium]|nr:5'/3'-nucleotidase SurE [Opitutales bacterium]MCH8539665.1 5'/3'-nucleotidase SurE [Opitutales bacterium]